MRVTGGRTCSTIVASWLEELFKNILESYNDDDPSIVLEIFVYDGKRKKNNKQTHKWIAYDIQIRILTIESIS